jgi:hypothetical protein
MTTNQMIAMFAKELGKSEALLRVAAVQLPRASAEDRAALLPYVKRDMVR